MSRKLLSVSAGAIAIAGSAFAADLPYSAPPPVYLPPPYTWTGAYLGGQIGYAWGTNNASLFANNLTHFFADSTFDSNLGGVIGGAHVGYNYQIPGWNWFSSSGVVIGLEGTVDGTSLRQTLVAPFSGNIPAGSIATEASSDIQGSIRGRVGVAFDRALIYATGGVAVGGFNATFSNGIAEKFLPVGSTSFFSSTRVGWTVGGGIEYAITNNWSVGAEYRYTDFGTFTDSPFADSFTSGWVATANHHITQNQVQVGFSYKFDLYTPPPVVAKY
jgi:outer membrane immunogenic protein